MKSEDIILYLMENLRFQARVLIEELGLFYPVGSVFESSSNSIRVVGTLVDIDKDSSILNYYKFLYDSMSKELVSGQLQAFGIVQCVKFEKISERKNFDGIEILINYLGTEYEATYLPYSIKDKQVFFGETLSLEEVGNVTQNTHHKLF